VKKKNQTAKKDQIGKDFAKSLKLAIFLTSVIFFVEVIGGYLSGSLALLGDAGHVFRDIFALVISLSALKIAKRLPSKRKTFGFHRVEIFAAFLNGMFLVAMGIWILWEAYQRLYSPQQIESTTMLIVAVIGFGVNLFVAFRLHGSHDLNVKSAFFHVVSDAAFSLAVIAAAVLIQLTGQTIFDPILSVLISVVIVFSAIRVIRESVMILLDFAPKDLDFDEVIQVIQKVEGVRGVHNVHLWSLCSNINVIDAHIYTRETNMTNIERIKIQIKNSLEKFHIRHVTLEFECEECAVQDELFVLDH
jgi:cobalt-zinc-cadmium efflux system protein